MNVLKYLFYDIIPDLYNIKWYKNDFDCKLEYYYWLPFRYVLWLVVSLLDRKALIYRVTFIVGFMKGGYTKCQNKQMKSRSGGL